MNIILKIIIVIMGLGLFFLAGYWGTIKQEKSDCYVLQQQSKEYQLFYLTKTDKEMCDHYQIPINAPVK